MITLNETLTIEELQRFLHLHDKHMTAYALQADVPAAIRAKTLADMAARRAEIEQELKRRLS